MISLQKLRFHVHYEEVYEYKRFQKISIKTLTSLGRSHSANRTWFVSTTPVAWSGSLETLQAMDFHGLHTPNLALHFSATRSFPRRTLMMSVVIIIIIIIIIIIPLPLWGLSSPLRPLPGFALCHRLRDSLLLFLYWSPDLSVSIPLFCMFSAALYALSLTLLLPCLPSYIPELNLVARSLSLCTFSFLSFPIFFSSLWSRGHQLPSPAPLLGPLSDLLSLHGWDQVCCVPILVDILFLHHL